MAQPDALDSPSVPESLGTFFVVSTTHTLLPLAHRLQVAGAQVLTVVDFDQFESCWAGRFEPVVKGYEKGPHGDGRAALSLMAIEHEATIITDSYNWTESLEPVPRVYGSHAPEGGAPNGVTLGGWWDGLELRWPHLWATEHRWRRDVGGALWTLTGGVPEAWQEALGEHKAALEGYSGPVRFNLAADDDGAWVVTRREASWRDLHWQAFDSALEDGLVGVLTPTEPFLPDMSQCTLATEFGLPPYPWRPLSASGNVRRAEWITAQSKLRWSEGRELPETLLDEPALYLHDIEFRDGAPYTGRTDGRVAVVTASATLPALAQAELAHRTQVLQGLVGGESLAPGADRAAQTLVAWITGLEAAGIATGAR